MTSARSAVGLARRQYFVVATAIPVCAILAAVARLHEPKPARQIQWSLAGRRVFPADNAWNQDVSKSPIDPNSGALIASIGVDKGLHADFGTIWNGAPNGIPYVVVDGRQPTVPVKFQYSDESDPGPYPIPPGAPIEGGPRSDGDRHVLVIDRDHWRLYELFAAYPDGAGWRAGSGAVFDLSSNHMRPAGWTSADAAGLPMISDNYNCAPATIISAFCLAGFPPD